jgi:hypothetical protein
MASEAAPAAGGGEDWKTQLKLPPKDSRIRTAVSADRREGAEREECLLALPTFPRSLSSALLLW